MLLSYLLFHTQVWDSYFKQPHPLLFLLFSHAASFSSVTYVHFLGPIKVQPFLGLLLWDVGWI